MRGRRAYGLAVDPDALVRDLSIGERQRVEILKVLMAGARLVILDEPTSVLAPQEVDALFAGVDELRRQGLSVVIITHKLAEARAIADRVPCCAAASSSSSGVDPATLDRRRAGRGDGRARRAAAARRAGRRRRPATHAGARARRASTVDGHGGTTALDGRRPRRRRRASWSASPASPATASASSTRWRSGLVAPTAGTVAVVGHEARPRRASAEAIAAGAVGVPEDPIADAVVPGPGRRRARRPRPTSAAYRKGLGIDWSRCGSQPADARRAHRPADGRGRPARCRTLSGGNIQRVMLVRGARLRRPTLVVAAYPSRGLDIATTRRTQELLLERRAGGAGVLLISEDLDELLDAVRPDRRAARRRIAGIVDARRRRPLRDRPADARGRGPASDAGRSVAAEPTPIAAPTTDERRHDRRRRGR